MSATQARRCAEFGFVLPPEATQPEYSARSATHCAVQIARVHEVKWFA